ncbi:MAG: efflux RND transporter periplasmic adaptor subunit [Steroidobacteraceae bacterium]
MDATQATSANTDRKVLYWYDPMVPNQHFDKPGKSPFMDMQMVAKYAGDDASAASQTGIQIDPGIAQNLGMRIASVQRGVIAQPITVAGSIGFNQRDVAIVQARTSGFVARVYQRAPGDVIARNAPLVDLLVPEWAGAQAEFLTLLKGHDAELIDAARQRLVLLGMSAELIAAIEKHRQPQATITIGAPIAGMIDSLEVREGMTISAGATLAKVNGLDTIWLEAQIPEVQSGLIGVGRSVNATLTAFPGEDFNGKVIAILPEANAATRTVRVRVELKNPQQRLRPGLFAQVRLESGAREPVLFVPSEAIIRSGIRNVVIVAVDPTHFEPVEIQVGSESNGKTIVLAGLQEGQKVVASGQFLIDSEASLQGVLARLSANSASPATASPSMASYEASGKIEAVSASEVLISHGPVPALEWGAMTMPFKIDRPEMARSLKVGDSVKFEFSQHDDAYVLQQIQKLGSTP